MKHPTCKTCPFRREFDKLCKFTMSYSADDHYCKNHVDATKKAVFSIEDIISRITIKKREDRLSLDERKFLEEVMI